MEKTLVILDPVLKKGFTALPNAVLSSRLISLAAKAMYGLLLMFAWQDNECFPGQERLAAVGNCSERSVRTYLTELKQAGYISWKQRGLNETNIYYINDLSTIETPEALNHTDRQNLPVKTGNQKPEAPEGPDPEHAAESLDPQGPAKSAGQDRKAPDRQNLPSKKTQCTSSSCSSSLRSEEQGSAGPGDPASEGTAPPGAQDPGTAGSNGGHDPGPAGDPKPPPNAALIGELGGQYRAVVPGEHHQQGDFAFIGRLYKEFGYDAVVLGINDLAYRIEARQVPENPLVYLRGIIARRRKEDDRPETPDGRPAERKPSKYPTRRIINGKEFYY